MSDGWIRLGRPPIGETEIAEAVDTLRSGFLVQGEQVALLEEEFASLSESSTAIAVGSGTAALHLALLGLGIGPGHTVATTTFSWPATANAIELVGATPAFVDIDPLTLNMDLDQLETLLESLPVSAILPVHAFGNPVDMTRLMDVASRTETSVIEDAACAVGGRWAGRPLGTFGELGCFSFHPRKIVTSGEGGMLIAHNRRVGGRLRTLRDHGATREQDGRFEFVEPGFNYRMTDVGAALLRPQLRGLSDLLTQRREIANTYTTALSGSRVTPQTLSNSKQSAIQAYVVSIPGLVRDERDHLLDRLRSKRIEASIATVHIPLTQYYSDRYGYKRGDFPKTDIVSECSIALPFHNSLSVDDVERVVSELLSALPGTPLA